MFRRGGSSFQAQGTGITSPYDVPRRGLVQQRPIMPMNQAQADLAGGSVYTTSF